MKRTDQNTTQLRQEAEAQLVRAPASDGSLRPAEELLHELEVYQIELNMQNEELRRVQVALEESRDRYVDLYEFAPVGYLTLSREAQIASINLTGAALLGEDRKKLLDRRFARFVAPVDHDRWQRYFMHVLQHGDKQICELTLQRGDGTLLDARLDCLLIVADAAAPALRITLTDITERKQAEKALLKAGALQSAIFNSTNFSSIATDAKGVIQIFNVGAERMLGYTAAEVMNKITPADISDPQEVIARAKALSLELATTILPGFEALVFKASRGIEDIYELTYIRKDGSRFPAVVSVTALRDEQEAIIGYLLIGTDNTARKQAESALRIAATAFESQDGMVVTDAHNVILRVNHAFTEITGYTAEEAVGQTPRLLKSGRHDTLFYVALWEILRRTGSWHGEIWNRRKNAEVYPEQLTITAVKDGTGETIHYVATMHDITKRKAMEEKINNLAFYDTLTQIPNRRMLNDRLGQAIAASKRSGLYGALMFLDLDNFKPLNDTYGHPEFDS